jgi:hypothetical protein
VIGRREHVLSKAFKGVELRRGMWLIAALSPAGKLATTLA